MQFVRMYTGHDGHSYFEDLQLPFDLTQEAQRTDIQMSAGMQYVYQPPGFVIDMHPAPRRQFVITLQGEAEIEMGNGAKRRFQPGDIVLAEDTTGEGHITRVIGDVPRISAQISLDT